LIFIRAVTLAVLFLLLHHIWLCWCFCVVFKHILLPFVLLVAHLLTVNALRLCQGTSKLTPGAFRFSHSIDRIVLLDSFISLCSFSIFTGLLIVGLKMVFVCVFFKGLSGLHQDSFTVLRDVPLKSLEGFVFLGKETETLFFEEIDSSVVDSVCDNNGEALILSAAL